MLPATPLRNSKDGSNYSFSEDQVALLFNDDCNCKPTTT
jgi:hypothetical protein